MLFCKIAATFVQEVRFFKRCLNIRRTDILKTCRRGNEYC